MIVLGIINAGAPTHGSTNSKGMHAGADALPKTNTEKELDAVRASSVAPGAVAASSVQKYSVECTPFAFGAKGDGIHDDTAAIQAAIDASASGECGGLTVLPAPFTFMSSTLCQRSHTVLRVQSGATLLANPLHSAYPSVWAGNGNTSAGLVTTEGCVRWDSGQGLGGCVQQARLTNITLDGGGTIDGNGAAWWFDQGPSQNRSPVIVPINVDGWTMRDVSIVRCRFWSVHILLCNNSLVSGIHLDAGVYINDTDYQGHNVDGIDPMNSQNVTIEDSWIWAGDDCIAIYSTVDPPAPPTRNVTVRNVTCHTPMSVTHGHDTQGVTFENCTVLGQWGAWAPGSAAWLPQWWHTALRVKTGDNSGSSGGIIADVTYRDIVVHNVHMLIDFQQDYPCQNSTGTANWEWCAALEPQTPGLIPQWRNFRFEGIRGSAWRAGWLPCRSTSPCSNITFADVALTPVTGDTAVLPWDCRFVSGSAGEDVSPPMSSCFASG